MLIMYFMLLLLSIIFYESNCETTPKYYFKNCTSNAYKDWFTPDNITCYYVTPYDTQYTWHDANEYCGRIGGQLASIHDQTSNQLLINITIAFYSYYNSYATKFWIGLNALRERGTYEWLDGSAYDYSHYPVNPPEGIPLMESSTYYTQGRCVYYYVYNIYDYALKYYKNYGYWYYDTCTGQHAFICQSTDGVVATPQTTPIPAGNCESDWIQYDNRKCIKFFNTSLTYAASLYRCRQSNGDLISIKSAKENNFVTALLGDISSPYIGLARDTYNRWSWADQSNVSYTNWGTTTQFSSYYNLDCVTILNTDLLTGKWNQSLCATPRPSICEKAKSTSITTPPPNPFSNCTTFPNLSSSFIQYQNSCYYISNTNSQWKNAENECQKLSGSHLASITNRFEYSFLMYYSSQFSPNTSYWIGLSSQEKMVNGLNKPRTFEWIDSFPVYNTFWDEDEPMQRPQASQVSVYQINGLWKTDDPNQYRNYICKKTNDIAIVGNNTGGICPQVNTYDPLQNWVDVDKKSKYCYWFSIDLSNSLGRDSWYASAFHCKQRNGSLLTVHSMNDLLILKNKLSTKSSQYDTWIGLYQTPEGEYVWDDISAVDFTNWVTTSDDNSNSQTVDYCVSVRASDLKFVKNKCSGYYASDNYYICQVPKVYNSGQTTPPTTTKSSPVNTTSPLELKHTDSSGSVGLSNGAKAGIIVSVVLVVSAIIFGAVFAFIKYKSKAPAENSFSNSLYASKRKIAKSVTDSM